MRESHQEDRSGVELIDLSR